MWIKSAYDNEVWDHKRMAEFGLALVEKHKNVDRDPKKASEVPEQMVARGAVPTVEIYVKAIAAQVEHTVKPRVDIALELFDDMQQRGLEPNIAILMYMINLNVKKKRGLKS